MKNTNHSTTFVVRKVRRIVWGLAVASYVPWLYVASAIWSRPTLGQSIGLGILGVIVTAATLAALFAALESFVRLLSTDDELRNMARRGGLPRN